MTGKLLGHKTPQMTERYAHLIPSGMKKALDDVFGKNSFENMQEAQLKEAMKIIMEIIEKNKLQKLLAIQIAERYSHLVPETLKKAVDDAWGKK